MTDTDIFGARSTDRPIPDELTLAVFNSDCPEEVVSELGATLSDCFNVEDVTVGETVVTEGTEFAVVHDGALFDGALLYGDDPIESVAPALTGITLEDTVFLAGYEELDGLRTLSHAVEKRAYRAGDGTLYVTGAQRLGRLEDHWSLYEEIVDAGVNVRVYDDPAQTPPQGRSVDVVDEGSHELAGTWLVAFDGAGNDAARGALLAIEREPDRYYGLWTADPAVVDEVLHCTVPDG